HASAASVRAASAAISKLILPHPAGPQISVNAPRGNPPVNASTDSTPVGAISTARRSRYWNGAMTRPASADSTSKRNAAADLVAIDTAAFLNGVDRPVAQAKKGG